MNQGSPLRHHHARGNHGFTLVELLVAAVVGSITVITASMLLGPHLRMNQRMEGYNRLQERWIRTSYLLDTEIQKASNVAVNGTTLTLTVPLSVNDGSGNWNGGTTTITYKLNGDRTQLLRDGPLIDRWGDSNPSTILNNQLVVDGVSPTNGFEPQLLNASGLISLQYTLRLIDPNSDATYRGKGSVARGRADCASIESDGGPCN